ncbi:hypothetical protein CCL07_09155 [Pseudomonas congelans]|uniref:hypothetical protein n=1 Tax=Pseudomonas congelans TaxID=200452 RepID=UPI000BB5D54E|nr:hypothetical protein [Pseudomonas congelans]PBQ07683.1 hypothetical protein CCL07_09155 [Pseudomonas congelans]
MTKLYLILYTCFTSLAYTFLVAYFTVESSHVPLGYSAAILIAVTGAIALGREKISNYDHIKALDSKDAEIEALKKSVKQKKAMLHSVRSRVVNVAINVNDKDDIVETIREIATILNESPVINNLDMEDGDDLTIYMNILKVNAAS